MTGKIQKQKALSEDFKKRTALTQEDKVKILDESIIEVFAKNKDFIEGTAKMSIKAFRGMYILHTFYSMIDKLAETKTMQLLNDKVKQYQEEEEQKRRR